MGRASRQPPVSVQLWWCGVMLVRWVKMVVVGVRTAFIRYGTMTLGHARRRVHPFAAVRRRRWFPWALVVVWESLWSLGVVVVVVGARSSYLGGCRRSWAVGVVGGGSLCVTWHGGDVVVRRMCVVVERCVVIVGGVVVGVWWLLGEEGTSQYVTLELC